MNKNYTQERLGVILVAVLIALVLFWVNPYFIIVFLPIFMTALAVVSLLRSERDEYYHARKNLLIAVFLVGFLGMAFYLITNSLFEYAFLHTLALSVVLGAGVLFGFGLLWATKRATPVSFLKEDPRIVQETMWEDGNYDLTLGKTFAYRGLTFQDLATGKKLKRHEIKYAKGELKPLELDVDDVETESMDDMGVLKPFYQAAIVALSSDLSKGGQMQAHLESLYGYSFTIRKDVACEKDFEKALAGTSLLYSKVYYFLKKDMAHPDLKVSFNFEAMFIDNLYCLELTLMLMIHMARQFVNFPVGDMAKYVQSQKDKNFLGAFGSMPSEYYAPDTTSVAGPGIAYYYVYYVLHRERFENQKETMARYIAK